MVSTAVSPLVLESLLSYWRECGIAYLCGDTPGAWLQPLPEAPAPTPVVSPPWREEVRTAPGGGAARLPPAPSFLPPRAGVAPVASPPVVPEPALPLPPVVPAVERPALLTALARDVAACQRCPLCQTRTQTVFGVGNPTTPVLFVGEAPGADEDRLGEPFVGAAGKLLDAMLHAVGFKRPDIYIANVIKCRPPANRNPMPQEVALCQGYLFRQVELIQPRLIFAMGKFAISSMTGHDGPVGTARGRLYHWRGIPVIPTYHPAYYLRQPGRKRAAWEDLLRLLQAMERQQTHPEFPPGEVETG